MPAYDVFDRLGDTTPEVALGRMNDYSLTEKDMRTVLSLFHEFRPSRVLEFGINEGSTASFILENCSWVKEYVGIDLIPARFPERGIVPKQAGWRAGNDTRLKIILTDETTEDFQHKMRLNGEFFDAIIMDANHEDWATKRDTDACEPFSMLGCLWIWHDYNVDSRQSPAGRPFGVKPYLDRLESEGRNIMFPDEVDRDPWKCCSVAWEVR